MKSKPRSIRSRILSRLMVPFLILVLLDAAVSYSVALHFANTAYDHWLLDSASSLVQQVKGIEDKITFELPPVALKVFRWDAVDKTFFKVESAASGFIAGDRALPAPAEPPNEQDPPHFSDGRMQNMNVRIVSLVTIPPGSREAVRISVAETLHKRRRMMAQILTAVAVPQCLLLIVAGFHIWTGISRGLKPLQELAAAIEQRSAKDLDPIPDQDAPFEVHSLTHTINALLQKLGAAMLSQRRFVENAAHQMRTPLAGLKLQAERALLSDDFEAMKLTMGQIKNAADRVAHLNDQLLTLARSESIAGGMAEFETVDLKALARQCCLEWAPKALERNIELGFDAQPLPSAVSADATLLRELVNNLLDNAIRYSFPGGHINVAVQADPRCVLIVEDDGPGIGAGEIDKVCERFYRTPGSPGDGCGLGLAIVSEIAELHNARIEIGCGAQGAGTRVAIVFPPSVGRQRGASSRHEAVTG
ncbi:sensor histidine kinase [Candidatus Methylomicrobium oryzae]|uniref:sensor histidine kinase n=1 Tax=Candidatus Methylomicrobium oryzae TaxID=2802053 RepID=UPI001922B865|nr:sensor histidine kinase [Methylomicrobium sp. RS1]MBL1263329.1 sensor histidine kinase N-terminal domain-containing protein [Methylomicrobium sp. RS1]